MCGIVGAISFDAQELDPAFLQSALDVLAHRGPDESGTWTEAGLLLGMCRLSIIDLKGGGQPIFNEDRSCCIIYNGELYNFLDLRPELEARGHRFSTHSDTEVILHGYEEWGVDCLNRLNGMFALAIWDSRNKTLLLARDRVGEKPLYYYRNASRLIFASEIKGILADPNVPRKINPTGLANFLAFGRASAPDTMYQDIYKLPPGHYMQVHNNQIKVEQYWDVGQEPQIPISATGFKMSEDAFAEHILTLLDDSVRRRMVADVPVGAFLSGGVDSSSIAALMMRHASGPVKTFSLGFTVGGAYNELSDARVVANALGTEHYELLVEHTDLVKALRTLVYHYDEPFGDAAGFPLYLISQFARQQVKVALAGDGADELFGGYRRYAADQAAGAYQLLPDFLTHRLVPAVASSLPRLRRIKRTLTTLPIHDPGVRYAAWLTWFSQDMQAELLAPGILVPSTGYDPASSYQHYYRLMNHHTAADHLNRIMYTDFKTLLADTYMEKVDKASMAVSLEVRVPFFDHRLVELAFQIPGASKIRGWSTKRILKRAVRGLIPESVLRKPKHGFAVPTDTWFRGALKDYTFEVLFDPRTRQRGLLNMEMVERLWREHLAGRNVWDTQLWLLLNLELWQRIYLDREQV